MPAEPELDASSIMSRTSDPLTPTFATAHHAMISRS